MDFFVDKNDEAWIVTNKGTIDHVSLSSVTHQPQSPLNPIPDDPINPLAYTSIVKFKDILVVAGTNKILGISTFKQINPDIRGEIIT